MVLGMVDHWLNGGATFYPIPELGYTAGSSYFPGDTFIALICRLLFGYHAEIAYIVTGGLFGIILINKYLRNYKNVNHSDRA